MKNTRENDKKWIQTLQERNRVLEELLALTQLENKELTEQLLIHSVVVPKGTLCDCINNSFLEDLCDDCDSQVNERWQP